MNSYFQHRGIFFPWWYFPVFSGDLCKWFQGVFWLHHVHGKALDQMKIIALIFFKFIYFQILQNNCISLFSFSQKVSPCLSWLLIAFSEPFSVHCGGWLHAWHLAWRLLAGVASGFFSCEDLLPIHWNPLETCIFLVWRVWGGQRDALASLPRDGLWL